MHICPVCTTAAIQVINDNMPVIARVWVRFKCWVSSLFKKPDPTQSEHDYLV